MYTILADQFPTPNKRWSEHCKGSESKNPHDRHTCSLWRLFHTLTVSSDSIDVAPKITNFILQFNPIECSKCEKHFRKNFNLNNSTFYVNPLQNLNRYQDTAVLTHPDFPVQVDSYENVIWLWKWHNAVNEVSRIPHYQFPRAKDCESCFDRNGEYVEAEVGKFLSSYYE